MSRYDWAHDDHKQALNDAIFEEHDMDAELPIERLERLIDKTEQRIDELLVDRMRVAAEFKTENIPCGTCSDCYDDVPLVEWFKDINGKFYCTACWDQYTGADEEAPPMARSPAPECDPNQLSLVALQVYLRQVLGADAVLPKTKPALMKMFREYYM